MTFAGQPVALTITSPDARMAHQAITIEVCRVLQSHAFVTIDADVATHSHRNSTPEGRPTVSRRRDRNARTLDALEQLGLLLKSHIADLDETVSLRRNLEPRLVRSGLFGIQCLANRLLEEIRSAR
jgi:hypothetical protein